MIPGEPTTEIPITVIYDLQRICWNLNNILSNTVIDTIPYTFTNSTNNIDTLNLQSDLNSLDLKLQDIINDMNEENPLDKRKKKLGNYIATDFEERLSKLEEENKKLRDLLKVK
jgi:hypothetical protein